MSDQSFDPDLTLEKAGMLKAAEGPTRDEAAQAFQKAAQRFQDKPTATNKRKLDSAAQELLQAAKRP